LQIAKVTFKVIQGHWYMVLVSFVRYTRFLLVFHNNYVSILYRAFVMVSMLQRVRNCRFVVIIIIININIITFFTPGSIDPLG